MPKDVESQWDWDDQTHKCKVFKTQFNKFFTAALRLEADVALICGDALNFVEATKGGVHIQTGVGCPIQMDTMTYRQPLHMPLLFPLSMMCGPVSAPQHIPDIPCMAILIDMGKLAAVCSSMPMACWGAEELYGVLDIRTAYARLYCTIHDNFFIRLYKRYGIQWASFVKKNSWVKPIVKPIWDFMWKKGLQLEKELVLAKYGRSR
ncbi:MAG: hypothetical protein CMF69_00275 [Magnetovibrio sp.]|nr:hypothetical protein [Magnetovibrio sp.]